MEDHVLKLRWSVYPLVEFFVVITGCDFHENTSYILKCFHEAILVKYCLLDENILIPRKNKVLRTLKSIVENLKSIFGMNQSQSMTCTCYFDVYV